MEVYIDDLVVHSKTIDEPILHLSVVFKQLRAANLKIKQAKCKWCTKQIKLLGHIITDTAIKMDMDKIKAIVDWKIPSKVLHIQQFIGICGYYRKFIRDVSKITAPLSAFIKKDCKCVWSNECQQAYDELKRKLISYPILRKPDFKKQFIIHTDASGLAIEAV